MKVKCKEKEYEIIFSSDVDNDGFFAECTAEGKYEEVLLYAFWSDADEDFTSWKQSVPFAVADG